MPPVGALNVDNPYPPNRQKSSESFDEEADDYVLSEDGKTFSSMSDITEDSNSR